MNEIRRAGRNAMFWFIGCEHFVQPIVTPFLTRTSQMRLQKEKGDGYSEKDGCVGVSGFACRDLFPGPVG
jgi:hypothetical protein